MPFLHFQALLRAGLRWRAREQQMAMIASAFPHMEESGQREAMSSIAAAAAGNEGEAVEDNTNALEALRATARINAALDGKRGG